MKVSILHDKKTIESHFRKNTDLNIYSIGDLDDFFWTNTIWYGLEVNGEIKQIILLYSGMIPPTLHAICIEDTELIFDLLKMIKPLLPNKFNAHLNPKLIEVFGEFCVKKNFGKHYKMALDKKISYLAEENKNVRRLNISDYELLKKLYHSSYPENWFDKRMLETGKYFGYFINGKIVGVSGIHVYSSKYKVAALGNITTDPNYRGKSICTKLTAVLCKDLLQTVDNIGLNVNIENEVAINCYKRIGFEIVGEYEEYLLDLSD